MGLHLLTVDAGLVGNSNDLRPTPSVRDVECPDYLRKVSSRRIRGEAP